MMSLAAELSVHDVRYQFEVGNEDMIGFVDFLVVNPLQNVIIDMKIQNDLCLENIL